MALSPGSKLGPYEIVSPLGAGGMGEVYCARDPRLKREVAIKVLPQATSLDPDRLRRFEQEALATATLNHPNILAVFDIGENEGSPYVVSELLEGETLRERLRSGAIATRKTLDYGLQIAHGLAAAHEKGIIHRDLKPENLFLTKDGRVKILDFGLAKLTQAGSGGQTSGPTLTHATELGTVLGTAGYMSPEQVRGVTLDARSDIFSFGVILYEMLSGKRVFHRDTAADTMSAILKEDPPDLSETNRNISPALERILQHCPAANPDQRFHSARDVAFDLESLSNQSGSASRLRAVTDQRRSYWKQAAGALIVVLALAGTYYVAKNNAPVLTPHFHQLTFQRGSIYGAKFAPDGQSIVYSAAWNGAPKEQVYTTRTDALMSRPIDLLDSEILNISSKGEMALRQKSDNGDVPRGMLSVVPLTGGSPRELLGDVLQAAWSRDGESLAAVHFVGPECRLEYPIGKIIYSTTTGYISDVAVSPDGKRIAFFDHPNGGDTRGYVAVVDLSGKVTRLTKEWSDLTGLAWSRSGDEIWFTGSDAGINSALYAVNLSSQLRDLLHIPGRLHLFDISKEGQVLIANEATRQEVYGRRTGQDRDVDLSWFDWTATRPSRRAIPEKVNPRKCWPRCASKERFSGTLGRYSKENNLLLSKTTSASTYSALIGFLSILMLAIPASATWKPVAAMPSARSNAAAETINGIVYVAGGYNAGGTSTLQAFNPTTNTWATLANMPITLYQGDGAGVINSQLYVTGGWNGPLPTSTLFRYDPASNTWVSLPTMSHLSACGGTGVINSKLYVTTACNGFSGYSNYLDVYDPIAGSWTNLPGSASPHAAPAVGVINDKLYVAGGLNGSGALTNELEVYDPALNSWSTLAHMPTAVVNAASVALNASGILLPLSCAFTIDKNETNNSYCVAGVAGISRVAWRSAAIAIIFRIWETAAAIPFSSFVMRSRAKTKP